VKNKKISQSGLIVMGDLKDFSKWSHCNGRSQRFFKNGLIVMGDLRPTQVKNMKIFQSGLIVMSDMSR
jgi:hypothetical protein